MGQHGPEHQGVAKDGGDEDDRECRRPDYVLHTPWVQNGQHLPEYKNIDRCHYSSIIGKRTSHTKLQLESEPWLIFDKNMFSY